MIGLKLLVIVVNWLLIVAHKDSPCPHIFMYQKQEQTDRWFGKITVETEDELEGVWIHITLDKEAILLLNWFGESTSHDNKEFTIKNTKYVLEPGPSVTIRIGVIFNEDETPPSVERIKLNGRLICPEKTRPNVTVFLSKPVGLNNVQKVDHVNTLNSYDNGSIRPNDFSLDAIQPPDSIENFSSIHHKITTQAPTRRTTTTTRRTTTRTSTTPSYGDSGSGENSTDGEYYAGDFAAAAAFVKVNGTRKPLAVKQQKQQCGTVKRRGTPLILHGKKSVEGEWPWHIALYRSEGISLSYICGGSLISESHVITAAHCVTRPQTTRPSNVQGLLVYLGSTNLKMFGPGIQVLQTERCYVHPEYNSTYLKNDVAILKLGRAALITDYVRPICLWSGNIKLDAVIGKLGSVVGWGFNEHHNITESLQEAKMPVVASDTCIYSNPDFFSSFTSQRTFCAGFRNGTTVCNGDSGGGMVFPGGRSTPGNPVWELRGLVSVGLALQGQNICDPSQYIVFTDLAKFLDWIKGILSEIDDDMTRQL